MKRLSSVIVLSVALLGCSQPTETVPTVTGGGGAATSGTTDDAAQIEATSEAPPSAEGASVGGSDRVRFVADTRLEIPSMMCPYGCYPAVEETLAKVSGVQGVQLAKQPEGTPEGEIRTKVVELKIGEGFDLESALAALKSASFDARQVN